MHDRAIVTLLIGESIQSLWRTYMERGWREYARKHDYDIVLIDQPLDTGPLAFGRSIHWQKCLVLDHPQVKGYRHAVWVDADISINHFRAPSIVDVAKTDKVGCVVFREGEAARERYERYGMVPRDPRLTNTGVLVMRPALHAQMMNWVYRNYPENEHSAKENIPLSYHLFENDQAEALDARFNVDWTKELLDKYPFLSNINNPDRNLLAAYCVHAAWVNSYFLHFINQKFVYADGKTELNTRDDIKLLYQEAPNPGALIVHRG